MEQTVNDNDNRKLYNEPFMNFKQILSLTARVTYILVSQKMVVLQNIVLIQTMWILDHEKGKKR